LDNGSFSETFPTPRLVHLFPSGVICNRYEIVCLRLCKNYSAYKYNIFVSAAYFSWLYTVKKSSQKSSTSLKGWLRTSLSGYRKKIPTSLTTFYGK
jgi:hypothetical protein